VTLHWKHVPQTIRPRVGGRTRTALCLTAFALTAAVVYDLGLKREPTPAPQPPDFTATVWVVDPSAKSPAAARIPIVYSDSDPQRAKDVVHVLAERYITDRRAQWRHGFDAPLLDAREAIRQSQLARDQAQARLDQFRQSSAKEPESAPLPPVTTRPKPKSLDNPQWLELDRNLDQLRRIREKLLAGRTAMHPAVQDVEARIADVQRQLADVPRKLTGPSTPDQEAAEIISAPELVPANERRTNENQGKLDAQTAEVKNAEAALRQAKSAEKQILAAMQTEPRFESTDAHLVESKPTMPVTHGRLRLLGTALVAGLLMSLAAASLATGADIDPPVASAAQVHNRAKASVVGILAADDPMPNPHMIHRRKLRVRRVLYAVGILFAAAAPIAAAWGILGG